MNQNFEIYSKAMYSTWLYHVDSRSLFDAGEGLTNYFGNYVFSVKSIFISHHHLDHIGSLMSFIVSRNSARGDHDKTLNIFYPDEPRLHTFISFIKSFYSHEVKSVNFYIVKPNQNICDTDKNHFVQTFSTGHTNTSIGYNFVEKRLKLKPEFVGQNIQALIKSNPDIKLNEEYNKILYSYCVDAVEVNPDDIRNAETLFVDSTFLNEEDRERKTHFTLDEAWELGKSAGVKNFVPMHFSSRYSNVKYCNRINKKFSKSPDFTTVYPIESDKIHKVKF